MRSQELTPIFQNISSIPGIGPKIENLFDKLVGKKLVNLLWNIPYNIIKREKHENILDAKINSNVTLRLKIIDHRPGKFKRQPYIVNCVCKDIQINIIFFYARHPYIKSALPKNEERFISGKLEYFRNNYQITHPSHIIKVDDINEIEHVSGTLKFYINYQARADEVAAGKFGSLVQRVKATVTGNKEVEYVDKQE